MTKAAQRRLDEGQVEIIGRHWLIRELLRAGLEAATPERDRGVDLIVYADHDGSGKFVARPIQLKSASDSSFAVDRKYERIPELLLAYVWHVADTSKTCCYCLTYPEAEKVARRMRWTRTKSWTDKEIYTVTSPGQKLVALLEPFKIKSSGWPQRIGIPP
jgi:hypothetical protein